MTEDFFTWMMDINLKAYFFAAQAVVAGMKAAGRAELRSGRTGVPPPPGTLNDVKGGLP